MNAVTKTEGSALAPRGMGFDLSPQTLQDTLRIALGLGAAHDPLDGPDAQGRMRLRSPLPARLANMAR